MLIRFLRRWEPPVKKSDQASSTNIEDAPVEIISPSSSPNGPARSAENEPDLRATSKPEPDSETEIETDKKSEDESIAEEPDEAEKNGIQVQAPAQNDQYVNDISPMARISLNDFSPGNWIEVRSHLDIGASLGEIASHCLFTRRDQDELVFVIDNQENSLYDSSHQESLGLALSDYFAHPVTVVISSGVTEQETPRAASVRDSAERHAAAVDRINSDATVVQFKQLFDGSLDESSVKPID